MGFEAVTVYGENPSNHPQTDIKWGDTLEVLLERTTQTQSTTEYGVSSSIDSKVISTKTTSGP